MNDHDQTNRDRLARDIFLRAVEIESAESPGDHRFRCFGGHSPAPNNGRKGIAELPTIPAGRPYFVMELVRGVPITEYCDKNKLSTQERLNLFIKVCQAIQHAHQKGIIHRDIKPSNVMVTLHDGNAVPKVIDFGIAKATNQKLTEKTLFTNFATMIGTPAYMSPEQAEMTSLDIDTRTDVYSLGVLLYELLTGTTPFPEKRLRSAGYGEMQRIIAEEEPEKPSTRLTHELVAAARQSAADSRKEIGGALTSRRYSRIKETIALVRGDLDWTTMKCLEKDRRRRYETANELAADLKRHLNDEPVSAVAPSAAYRFQKAWRRNKLVYSAGAAVFAALVIGISVSVWQAKQAVRARKQAERAESARALEADNARRERDIARVAEARADGEAEANRLNLYAADMTAAQLALNNLNYGMTRQLLDKHRPTGNQKDLRGFEWRLLWQQSHGDQIHTIRAHSDTVHCVTFSPDGKYLLSGSRDGTITVSEVDSGIVARSWKAHEGYVNSISFSPDGTQVATGGSNGAIKLWEWPGGVLISKLSAPGGYAKFDRTSGRLYIGSGLPLRTYSSDVGVKTVELGTPSNPESIGEFSQSRFAFAIPNGDGSLVAIGASGDDVQLMDSNGKVLRRIEGTRGPYDVAWSPGSKLLAESSLAVEKEIRIYDVNTGSLLERLTNHTGRVWSLDFSPDGRLLASASSDQTIRIWEVSTWREIKQFRGHGSEVWAVAFSPDGKSLASGSKDTTVRIWKVEASTSVDRIEGAWVGYGSNAGQVFLHQGRLFAARHEGHVGIWSVSSGRLLHELPTEIFCLGEDENRAAILTLSPGPPYVLRYWDMQDFGLLHDVKLTLPSDSAPGKAAWLSQDRRSIVLTSSLESSPGQAVEIDCATGFPRRAIPLPEKGANPNHFQGYRIQFSPDRSMWAALSNGSTVALIPSTDPTEVTWPRGHRDNVYGLAFSPTEKLLATASIDNTARLWELPSGRPLAVLAGHKEGLFSCAFSPDGRTLATASGDKTVKLWHVATRREMLTLQHDQPVAVCVFSPEGNCLATGTIDNAFHFWRAPTLDETGVSSGP